MKKTCYSNNPTEENEGAIVCMVHDFERRT